MPRAGRRPRLHHHQPVTKGRQQCEQVQQHRHGDVVGEVRDQRGWRRPRQLGDSHRVGLDDLEPVGLRRVRTTRRWRGARAARTGSTSTATTRPADSSSASVSEPRPGPTSSTTSSAVTARRAHDAADGVGVDDEVLAALLGRPQPELARRADAPPPAREVSDRRTDQRRGSAGSPTWATLAAELSAGSGAGPLNDLTLSVVRRGRRRPARRRSRPRRRGPAPRRRSAPRGSSGPAGRSRRTPARCRG